MESMATDLLHQIAVSLLAHAERRDEDDLDYLIAALDAVQALYRSGVALAEIPAPSDIDPRVRAIKASVLERLVEVWGAPPHDRPHERAPSWCSAIEPSPEEIWLIPPDFAGHPLDPTFGRRNIRALANFLMFA